MKISLVSPLKVTISPTKPLRTCISQIRKGLFYTQLQNIAQIH